ncbi:hypothetical protein CBR_g1091 [Chara braunii]|uniref:DUF659 domain-containing protein n=1 Tax=Chara braunii TaxID=69332 RepID=A0A388KD38_CHABU|nr:hypothetical protein CBR_g1091 [Chara braunii]|eukprot:GBG67972.1 hypothetical protein CBR_g1091 [Chara braunii]
MVDHQEFVFDRHRLGMGKVRSCSDEELDKKVRQCSRNYARDILSERPMTVPISRPRPQMAEKAVNRPEEYTCSMKSSLGVEGLNAKKIAGREKSAANNVRARKAASGRVIGETSPTRFVDRRADPQADPLLQVLLNDTLSTRHHQAVLVSEAAQANGAKAGPPRSLLQSLQQVVCNVAGSSKLRSMAEKWIGRDQPLTTATAIKAVDGQDENNGDRMMGSKRRGLHGDGPTGARGEAQETGVSDAGKWGTIGREGGAKKAITDINWGLNSREPCRKGMCGGGNGQRAEGRREVGGGVERMAGGCTAKWSKPSNNEAKGRGEAAHKDVCRDCHNLDGREPCRGGEGEGEARETEDGNAGPALGLKQHHTVRPVDESVPLEKATGVGRSVLPPTADLLEVCGEINEKLSRFSVLSHARKSVPVVEGGCVRDPGATPGIMSPLVSPVASRPGVAGPSSLRLGAVGRLKVPNRMEEEGEGMGTTSVAGVGGAGQAWPETRPHCAPKVDNVDVIHDSIDDFLTENCLSFAVARSRSWSRMLYALREAPPSFLPHSCETLRTMRVARTKERLLKRLPTIMDRWDSTGCMVHLEGWRDGFGPHLDVMISSPVGTVFWKSVRMGDQLKDATAIFSILQGVIQQVGPQKVVGVLMDNARVCKLAGRMVQEEWPHIFPVPCLGHSLDLSLQQIAKIEWVQSILCGADRLVTFFTSHPKVVDVFRSCSRGRRLTKPSRTGVIAAMVPFKTLHNLVEMKDCLCLTAVSSGWNRAMVSPALHEEFLWATEQALDTSGFWSSVEKVHSATRTIIQVLQMTDRRPLCLGEAYMCMDFAVKSVRTNRKLADNEKTQVLQVLMRRWEDAISPLHCAGHFLNPELRVLNKWTRDDEVMPGLNDWVTSWAANKAEVAEVEHELGRYLNLRGTFGREQAKQAAQTLPAHSWWYNHGQSGPVLKRHAQRLLGQVSCMSVCSLKKWRLFQQIHSGGVEGLAGEQLSDVVFNRWNMHLLEDAGGEEQRSQLHVLWEEDTKSGAVRDEMEVEVEVDEAQRKRRPVVQEVGEGGDNDEDDEGGRFSEVQPYRLTNTGEEDKEEEKDKLDEDMEGRSGFRTLTKPGMYMASMRARLHPCRAREDWDCILKLEKTREDMARGKAAERRKEVDKEVSGVVPGVVKQEKEEGTRMDDGGGGGKDTTCVGETGSVNHPIPTQAQVANGAAGTVGAGAATGGGKTQRLVSSEDMGVEKDGHGVQRRRSTGDDNAANLKKYVRRRRVTTPEKVMDVPLPKEVSNTATMTGVSVAVPEQSQPLRRSARCKEKRDAHVDFEFFLSEDQEDDTGAFQKPKRRNRRLTS